MEKIAYKYDEKTGKYLGKINAFLDSVRSLAEERDVYILPANSTFLPVPTIPLFHSAQFDKALDVWTIIEDYSQASLWDKRTVQPASIGPMEQLPQHLTLQLPLIEQEGLTNYFNDRLDSWELIPDLRGKTFYKKISGEAVVIAQVEPLSDDLTDKKKPDQFYKWDDKKNDWAIDKTLKKEFITTQNSAKKLELKIAAEERITLLERKEKLKRVTEQDLILLGLLYEFTLDLDALDSTQENLIFPNMPS